MLDVRKEFSEYIPVSLAKKLTFTLTIHSSDDLPIDAASAAAHGVHGTPVRKAPVDAPSSPSWAWAPTAKKASAANAAVLIYVNIFNSSLRQNMRREMISLIAEAICHDNHQYEPFHQKT